MKENTGADANRYGIISNYKGNFSIYELLRNKLSAMAVAEK